MSMDKWACSSYKIGIIASNLPRAKNKKDLPVS